MSEPDTVAPVWLAVALGALAVAAAVVTNRMQPPAPMAVDVGAPAFSAGRAEAGLRELAGDGAPHPAGSAAHEAVRARLVARLERLGLPVAVRESFACSAAAPVCGTVRNVVARLRGRAAGPAVLVAAHYDSVAAGPGIADDLASVAAIVEMARALEAGPPLRNPVVFLLDDGEEAGLLGAEAFVADRAASGQVGAVVNLEARGTGGLSLMFETSEENEWLVDLYARTVPRPAANSVSLEAYKRLPNDTDLTVFKRAGIPGMNFAFIDELSHYHTPLDDLGHLDLGSLQHQGESALAVVRALALTDLSHPPSGRAVYQDVLGFVLVRWPAPLTEPIAAGAAALLLLSGAASVRRRRTTFASVAWGLGGFVACIVAVVASGLAVTWVVQLAARTRAPWLAHPATTQVGLWAAALVAGGAVASLTARRAGFRGMLAGTWLGWGALGIACAALLPGASTLFLIPAVAAALSFPIAEFLRPAPAARMLAATCAALVPVASVVWLPLSALLAAAFGLGGGLAVALPLAMVLSTAAPLLALDQRCRRVRALALATAGSTAAFATVAAVFLPKYSTLRPQPLDLVYTEDCDRGAASWVAGTPVDGLPDALRRAAAFGGDAVLPFPWPTQKQYVAPAPTLGAAPPELAVDAITPVGGGRTVRARLRSARGAPNLAVFVPAGAPLRSMTANGRRVAIPSFAGGGVAYRRIAFVAVPEEGVELDLELGGVAPVEVIVADQSPGLPRSGDALVAARPPTAVPIGAGDVTILLRRVRL